MSDLNKDESAVNFALLDEEKLLIKEFIDSEKLERAYKDKRYVAIGTLVEAISDDENKLSLAHPVLLRKIADWKGDFEKELRVNFGDNLSDNYSKITSSGIKGIKEIYALLREIYDLEKQVQPIFDTSKLLCTNAKQKFGNVTVNSAQSMSYDAIAKYVKELHNAFLKWIAMDKKLDEIITKANKHLEEYQASSPELQNYVDVDKHMGDISRGTGKYQGMSLKDRQEIIMRYMRANFSRIERNSLLVKQMQDFLRTGDFGDLPKPDSIENPKINEWMYYNDSLARLRKAQFRNHLRPIQFYEILLEHFRTNVLGIHEDVAKNILSGKDEWLSVAFRKKGNILEISWDPENIAWNGKKYVTSGELRVDASFDIGKKKSGNYYNIGEFPSELVHAMYGADAGELSKYSAGIYLPPEDKWWLVGTGNLDDGYLFILGTGIYQRASRGVR
jgi:hypothetical protein